VHIFNAGWHFGYVMEPERIAEKIGAFSHSEFDNPYFRDMARIERCRQDHTDLFERQVNEFEIVGLNEMPQVIRNNPEKYKDFIYDYESYSRCYSVLPEPQTA
jgi:beta-1,4-mannosyl-glycoprotein beta-1,4-N-acetylglucosaminyltransferase